LDPKKEDQIDERRAAMLLGLSTGELRRLSRLSGLGHIERNQREERMVYTYEELRRLCLLAAPSVD
jgi:hypothetical protein